MSRLLRGALAVAVIVLSIVVARVAVSSARWPWTASAPRVTHEMVVSQIQNVAKLVSTELTLRDVVSYQQSKFESGSGPPPRVGRVLSIRARREASM